MSHADTEPLFDAVLYPHRSLSPVGIRNVILGLAAILGIVAACLTALGAWPVLPFFGCEVLLIWWAFKTNARDGRVYERVRLTQDALTVARVRPSGQEKHQWIAPPHWLRVDLTACPSGDNELRIVSHGRILRIGKFLTPEERGNLAEELQKAIKRLNKN